jgi:opine dehydrogenase
MDIALLGAGHGGLATAGHLGLKGHAVRLFSFHNHELVPVREAAGIRLEGAVKGMQPGAKT